MNKPGRQTSNTVKSNPRCMFAAFAVFSTVLLSLAFLAPYSVGYAQPAYVAGLQPMSLTIVASNGTQVVLNSTDIAGLASYRAAGGYKNSIGTLVGPFNYTGVPLTTLLDLVGGITSSNSLKVIASDNYTAILTYDQVTSGNFTTYDPVTGNPVQHNKSLTAMLAYYKNDVNLTSDEGPLRLVIVGPESLLTDSINWVKYVVKIEVGWSHDVAITAITSSKTVVGENYSCRVNVTLANLGAFTETLNVSLQCNGSVAASTTNFVLDKAASATATMIWNTTGFAFGNYTINAYASPVPGETNIANNNFTGGWVIVSLLGDITGPTGWPDGKVDMRDISLVARNFGKTVPPGPPNCDLTGSALGVPDGKIDMRDISLVAKNFGKYVPYPLSPLLFSNR